MSQNDEREAFEAWYFDKHLRPPFRGEDGFYVTFHARDAYEGWCAALANQRAEVPQPVRDINAWLAIHDAEQVRDYKVHANAAAAIFRALLATAPAQPAEQQGSGGAMFPACKGMNCGATDGVNHSLECQAEHAAAIAGGVFVKSTQHPRQMVALTDEVIVMQGLMMVPSKDCESVAKVFEMGVRFAERMHGIPAPGGKE